MTNRLKVFARKSNNSKKSRSDKNQGGSFLLTYKEKDTRIERDEIVENLRKNAEAKYGKIPDFFN